METSDEIEIEIPYPPDPTPSEQDPLLEQRLANLPPLPPSPPPEEETHG